MLLMAAATFAFARLLDGLGQREVMRLTGLARFDAIAVLLAIPTWLAVLAVSSLVDHQEPLRALVERVDWLRLPPWHFQQVDGFTQLAPVLGGFALVANVVCEEMWFRGYLQDKLRFLGPLSWVVAGLLFTLYHVFEAPIAYRGSSALWRLPVSGRSDATSGHACSCTHC